MVTPVIKQIKKGTIIIIAQYYKTFDLIPKFFCAAGVSLSQVGLHFLGVYGSNGLQSTKAPSSFYFAELTWQEHGITWYADNAEQQFNESNKTYYYIVIGE